MVASTGMTSACLSSLILGSFMCTLVIFCRKFALNPGKMISGDILSSFQVEYNGNNDNKFVYSAHGLPVLFGRERTFTRKTSAK